MQQSSALSACVRACVRACGVFFTPAVSPSHCTLSPHTTICVTHGYTVCVRCVFHVSVIRFSDTFQWRKTFGLLFRCANLQLQCAATSISLALTSISLAQTSFVLTPQQMAALNFLHFYFVKWFVKMVRKVTSNIKFKKYKILNKRSTNNVSNFLTFQTVFKKLIRIRTFDAGICFE